MHSFSCYGSGPCESQLRLVASHYNNFNVFSQIHPTKIQEIYHKTDILFFPSLFEGLPKVMLEAGATGVPILASNATGHPELIKNGKI